MSRGEDEVGKNTATISVLNVMHAITGHLHWKYFLNNIVLNFTLYTSIYKKDWHSVYNAWNNFISRKHIHCFAYSLSTSSGLFLNEKGIMADFVRK